MIQSDTGTITSIMKGDGETTPVMRIMAKKYRPQRLWEFKSKLKRRY